MKQQKQNADLRGWYELGQVKVYEPVRTQNGELKWYCEINGKGKIVEL